MEDQSCESTVENRLGSQMSHIAVPELASNRNSSAGAAIWIETFLCSPVRDFQTFLLLCQKKEFQQIKHQISPEVPSANKSLQLGRPF